MSLENEYFIAGIPVRPVNADEIGVKLDWTGEAQEAELSVDSIQLSGKGKKLVLDHIAQLGVFEGLPFTAKIGGYIIEYFIDLTEDPRISGKGDSTIEVSIFRREAVKAFRENADGLSFEALNKTHPITTVDISYLIVRDNQAEMLLILGISTFTLTKSLIEGIKELVTIISAGAVESATPGISAAGPTTSPGAIIAYVLRITAQAVYLAAIIIALIDLTKQILEIIFPPVRTFKGTQIKELLTKGCQKLGYTFTSSIIDSNVPLTICPVPLTKGNQSIFTKLFTLDTGYYNKGYPTANDSTPTLGSLLTAVEQMFNAKIRIVGNQVVFERRDYWILNSNIQIVNTLNLQDARENQWRYNLGEAWKRYYIHYRTDSADTHTMDNIDQTDIELSTEPVTTVNQDLLRIRGLVDIAPPFAFGVPKSELTWVEEVLIPFAKLADDVIAFFGGSSNYEASIAGRIGVMQISQQYFTATKLMWVVGKRQPLNVASLIGASWLWNNYHIINKVKENFKRIYNATIPFSTQNFEMLLENNYVTDELGNSLEILTFEFMNEGKIAEIEYSILSDEGFNTKTILIDA